MTLVTDAVETGSPYRYADERPPVLFPESAEVPETQEHFEQRILLYQLLFDALGPQVTVGSDQFIYFDAEDPKQVLAPDVYVRLSPTGELVRSWKVWERGAPEVCVEVASDSDAAESAWQEKLAQYRRLGTREVIRFEPRNEQRPLRVWDRLEGRLLERDFGEKATRSLVLGLDWCVLPLERLDIALRIRKDGALVPTRAEARIAAEARVRELEAALARR